jgi:hypothetical protein
VPARSFRDSFVAGRARCVLVSEARLSGIRSLSGDNTISGAPRQHLHYLGGDNSVRGAGWALRVARDAM